VRVALFVTCVNDAMFPGTGRAVVTLLRRLGCEVDFPLAQTRSARGGRRRYHSTTRR
jgi:L-lactate dehydrogenase complex protein LldE